jgi:hypothetical protein
MGRNEFVNAMFQNIWPSNVKNVDVFVLNWNDYLKERVINECVKFYNHFGQNIISRFDLGAFAMVRKATIRYLMSVCPHGKTCLQLDGFDEIQYLKFFRKYVEKKEASLEYRKNKEYFT